MESLQNCSQFVETLGIGRSRHSDLPNTFELDDLNRHFCTVPTLDSLTKCQTLDYLAGLTRPDINLFAFTPVDPGEMRKIILSIKSKAVGYDGISRHMIETVLNQLLRAISLYH